MIVYLLIISLVSFLTVSLMVYVRVLQIRGGREFNSTPSLYSLAWPKAENIFYLIVNRLFLLLRFSYLHLLLFLSKIMSILKLFVIKIDKKFSRVTNSVRGKEELNKAGETSLFFKKLKDHK